MRVHVAFALIRPVCFAGDQRVAGLGARTNNHRIDVDMGGPGQGPYNRICNVSSCQWLRNPLVHRIGGFL